MGTWLRRYFKHVSLSLFIAVCFVTTFSISAKAAQEQHLGKDTEGVENKPNVGTTYYISSSTGNDANDGLTPETAWRTLYMVYGHCMNFEPGDSILLKRGDVWRNKMMIWDNGSEAEPIVIASYGEGTKPILYGHAVPTPWTPVEGHPGVYSAPIEMGTIWAPVYDDGIRYYEVTSGNLNLLDSADIDAYLSSFPSGSCGPPWGGIGRDNAGHSDIIWIRTVDDAPPGNVKVMWASPINVFRGSSYITIEGLDLRQGYTGTDICGSDHIVFRNNSISDFVDIGIYLRWDNTNCLMDNNTLSRTGNDGILVLTGDHNTMRGNAISHVGGTIMGIPGSGDRDGIGLEESKYNLVEHNHISFALGQGCAYYIEEGSIQQYNYYYHVGQGSVPHGTNLTVHHNVFYVDWQEGNYSGRGMNVVNLGGGPIRVYNNVFYRVSGGISVSEAQDSVIYRDNIIYGMDPFACIFWIWTTGAKVSSDYNIFYGSEKFAFGPEDKSFEDFQAAGYEVHSFYAEPEFVSDNPLSPEEFKLAANSPAIDAGQDLKLAGILDPADPYLDFAGATIPQGTTADIGAFEFTSGTLEFGFCCGKYTGGWTGNTDCSEDGKRNLVDISKLIDRVYISKSTLCCEENGNTNGDTENKINLADITRLIDHVYISTIETAECK